MNGPRARGAARTALVGVAAAAMLAVAPAVPAQVTVPDLEELCRQLAAGEVPALTGTGLTLKQLRELCGEGGGSVEEGAEEATRTLEDANSMVQGAFQGSAAAAGGSAAGGSGGGGGPGGAGRGSGGDRRAAAAQARPPAIDVDKTNDADGDGSFSGTESAPAPGADVPFRVEITNVGRQAVVVRDVRDSFQFQSIPVCRHLVGQRLRPGDSRVCIFLLQDYAPARNDARANTVHVEAEGARGGQSVLGWDISVVLTEGMGADAVLGETATPGDRGGPLALTGRAIASLAAAASIALVTGSGLVCAGRRRRRSRRPRARR